MRARDGGLGANSALAERKVNALGPLDDREGDRLLVVGLIDLLDSVGGVEGHHDDLVAYSVWVPVQHYLDDVTAVYARQHHLVLPSPVLIE